MQRKYLVFISSSNEDLKAERRELTKIVSEMGAVPVSMDAFDFTQEEDRKIIYKAIEDSDYFLNITAFKGGELSGKTFIPEAEYLYAIKADIPVLALIIDDKARWKDSKKEKEASAVKALENFKKKLNAHPHETWTNIGDLRQKALLLLTREMNIKPRNGWVPSTQAIDPSIANELARLIRENNSLKYQLRLEGIETAKKHWDQIKHVLKLLAVNRVSLGFYYIDGKNWENSKSFRYLRLFRLLAPELYYAKNAAEIARFLGNILNPNLEKVVRSTYPVPSNTIKKIMTDLTALKLMKANTSAITGSAKQKDEETWDITEYGKEVYSAYRLRQMETKLARTNQAAQTDLQ